MSKVKQWLIITHLLIHIHYNFYTYSSSNSGSYNLRILGFVFSCLTAGFLPETSSTSLATSSTFRLSSSFIRSRSKSGKNFPRWPLKISLADGTPGDHNPIRFSTRSNAVQRQEVAKEASASSTDFASDHLRRETFSQGLERKNLRSCERKLALMWEKCPRGRRRQHVKKKRRKLGHTSTVNSSYEAACQLA